MAKKIEKEVVKKKGLAALSPERRSEIARMGAKKLHESGAAHAWTTKTGRAAGIRSGIARRTAAKA